MSNNLNVVNGGAVDQSTGQNLQDGGSSNLFPSLNGGLQNGSTNSGLNTSGSNVISLPGFDLNQEVDSRPSVRPTTHRWLLAGGVGLVIVAIAVIVGWRMKNQLSAWR